MEEKDIERTLLRNEIRIEYLEDKLKDVDTMRNMIDSQNSRINKIDENNLKKGDLKILYFLLSLVILIILAK